ncbi:MAG TPA: DUF4350 domain-containing protein [Opitutales bacterium]|nr:DUF4350 domain-containing protein [Opitutales bacterium]
MKRALPLVLLVLGALVFALGLAWMLEVRLERGDTYPPSSSLRSDPLGTMALYESLYRLPSYTVARDFGFTNQLPGGAGTAYLHLGGDWQSWESLPADLFGEIEAFLSRGGRLVVVFSPVVNGRTYDRVVKAQQAADDKKNPPDSKNPPTAKKPEGTGGQGAPEKPAVKKPTSPDDRDDDEAPTVSLKDKWGVNFDFDDLPADDKDPVVEVRNVSGLALPAQLDWRSGLHFKELDPAWRAVYSRGQDPVVIERRFGAGTMVMSTDGYFLSNEALRKERHADLLAWLLGSAHHIVFDEAHFGIVEMPGVAGLIRRYRLTALVGSFIVIALLFIWKNSSSLVPAHAGDSREDFVQGRASSVGFVNLLRRNVPPADLLPTCLAEWKKSSASGRPGVKLAEVQAVVDEQLAQPARQRDAAQAYRQIVAILKRPAFSTTAPPTPPKISASP